MRYTRRIDSNPSGYFNVGKPPEQSGLLGCPNMGRRVFSVCYWNPQIRTASTHGQQGAACLLRNFLVRQDTKQLIFLLGPTSITRIRAENPQKLASAPNHLLGAVPAAG